jgi:hypothetical protein
MKPGAHQFTAALAISSIGGQGATASVYNVTLSPSDRTLNFCGFVTGDHFSYHAVDGAPLSGSS